MYDKAQVIAKIGYHRWNEFEMFMLDKDIEIDEWNGEELYYAGYVADFLEQHK